MRKLAELMQVHPQLVRGGPNPDLAVGNLLAEWGDVPYAQLSVLLVHLRFLATLHQTHHWTAKGDPFYGDHLLFERLYDTVVKEVDDVAEKAVGLGGEQTVNLMLQLNQLKQLGCSYGETQAVPQATTLAQKSLLAEVNFVRTVDALIKHMQAQGTCTPGVENMLQGIADVHERHVYLLKRRCTQPAMGM